MQSATMVDASGRIGCIKVVVRNKVHKLGSIVVSFGSRFSWPLFGQLKLCTVRAAICLTQLWNNNDFRFVYKRAGYHIVILRRIISKFSTSQG